MNISSTRDILHLQLPSTWVTRNHLQVDMSPSLILLIWSASVHRISIGFPNSGAGLFPHVTPNPSYLKGSRRGSQPYSGHSVLSRQLSFSSVSQLFPARACKCLQSQSELQPTTASCFFTSKF